MTRLVYLVEDDGNIRDLVTYTLRQSGIEAEGFARPSAFWQALDARRPDLVLLDIMLPEEDGLAILRRLRGRADTAALPVMMLTARGSEYDKAAGLDLGADDYLAKPFGMLELTARVRALLRRAGPAQEDCLRAGAVALWPERRIAQADGREIALTRKEFDLLALLLRAPGRAVTRERLLREVWGYGFQGESRTVDVHVRTLRQKLGAAGDQIETVRGVGYRLRGGDHEA